MFGLSTIKLVLYGIAAAGVISAVGVAYYSYKQMQQTIKEQAAAIAIHQHNEATFRSVIANKQAEIDEREQQLRDAEHARVASDAAMEEARARVTELEVKFAAHDLSRIAERKPGLLAKRIEAATERVFSDFEALASLP